MESRTAANDLAARTRCEIEARRICRQSNTMIGNGRCPVLDADQNAHESS